ncbi:putative nucleolar complex protein 14 [Paramyrothecium foliicola]|nr:putative nucleolar complex protein 14 [Paramyrothecium foliicola]
MESWIRQGSKSSVSRLLSRLLPTTAYGRGVQDHHQPTRLARHYRSAAFATTNSKPPPPKRHKHGTTIMATTVELAMVPTADTPGVCLYVHHDASTYIFGHVPEGTQRAFASRRLAMGSTKHIFLSGAIQWQHVGGLLGYMLSASSAVESAREVREADNLERKQKGRPLLPPFSHDGVGIHAGDNLCHTLAASRAVIFRQPLTIRTHEHRDDPRAADPSNLAPDWQDHAVRVWKIPVRRTRSSSPQKRHRSASPSAKDEWNTDAANAQPSSGVQNSDPALAAHIVEEHMFNGKLGNLKWVPRKLSELKPTETAIIWRNNRMALYTGPFATDDSSKPLPEGTAYVMADENSSVSDEVTLPINHVPLPPASYSDISMSYIMKTQDRRGKFNPIAAKSLGVQPKDFSLLTKGESVKGKDGITVTPDMVLGETQPGRGIVVADVESSDFLDCFVSRPEWSNKELLANIVTMYWILGPGLAQDARVQKFISEHTEMKHVFCAPDTCPNAISINSAAELHTKMRCVDAERYPMLQFDNTVDLQMTPAGSPVESGRAGAKFQLMPRLMDKDHPPAFVDLLQAASSVDEEVLKLAREARELSTSDEFLARIEEQERDIPNRDAEIIALGTGSSVPSKHRNVSGTLIRIPGIGSYQFDSGEGTLGQIRRFYGLEKTAEVLRDLRCIVISHLHADHHLGTISLIKAWYEQTLKDQSNATLAIVCIARYKMLLEELAQVEDFGFHRLRFPSSPWDDERELTTAEDLGEENFGLASIKRIPVPHCWKSYGTQLEFTSGLRIAYSGDCRPSSDFARACEGAHLLIHECTFDNDMQKHAKAKKHSTMAEALDVARQMKARRTLLTHFSQRYTKSGSLRHEGAAGEEKAVLVACDLMMVKLGDFQKAACFTPAIELLMEKESD